MSSIYTMEYYSAIKNNEFIKSSGQWMKLENSIVSETCKLVIIIIIIIIIIMHMHSLISGY